MKGRGADKAGRSVKIGIFVALPHFMLNTPAWRTTSPAQRSVLVELLRSFNGGNNGELILSARDGAKRCGVSKNTVARALRQLAERGLIEPLKMGVFSPFEPMASEWRATWLRCHVTGALPSKAFMQWQSPAPKKTVSGVTRGTVRYHQRDSEAEKQPVRCHQRDKTAPLATRPSVTTDTLIESNHTPSRPSAGSPPDREAGDSASSDAFAAIGDTLRTMLEGKP